MNRYYRVSALGKLDIHAESGERVVFKTFD